MAITKKNKNVAAKKNNTLNDIIAENAEQLIEIVQAMIAQRQSITLWDYGFSFGITIILVILMGGIVYVAYTLTQQRIIDGSTFTFLLGTIVGYLLTYLKSLFNSG